MREILFRGKTDDGKWVEGVFFPDCLESLKNQQVHWGFIKRYWEENESPYTRSETVEVLRETVGQFTGLTDKNGKKIFEGDIIKIVTETDDEEYPFVAEFFEIMFDDEKHRFVKRSDLGIDDFDYSKDEVNEYKIEVVGNIYDNHELLED